MAEMKYLNTRIQLKIDTLANWSEKNPVLLAGELAVVSLGNSHTTTTPDNGTHPILFKVGPGNFNSLPFASALAADVYAWAKQSENDFVNTFLGLKMSDGTTMQTKLDAVFATDSELATAIENLRKEIPTAIGVMSVSGKDAIKCTGDADVTVELTLDNSGNVVLSQSTNGLKAEIDLSEYAKTADLPEIVASGDDEIALTAEGHTLTGSHAAHAAGSAKSASTASISGYEAIGEIKIPKIVTNAAGHVTEISEETVSISLPAAVIDTNTAHSHTDGIGVKVTGEGGIDGEVKIDLDVKFNDSLVEKDNKKYLQILDATDDSVIAEFDATEFVKDGMLSSVSVDQEKNEITFTWNTDGDTTATTVKLSEIADIYTGSTNGDITVTVSNENVISATLNKQFALASDLANYKTKQTSYSADGSTTKTITAVSQNENGEVTVTYGDIAFPNPVDISGKKDKQEAVANKITKPAHVLSTLTQNENGDISYEVKELTPADIGAPTVEEMSNQDAVVLAEAQKYTDSLHTTYSAEAGGGLKLNDKNEFAIDNSMTFIFYCGTASELV